MTPIARFYARLLPPRLAMLMVAMTYAALLFFTVVLVGNKNTDPLVYLDLPEAREDRVELGIGSAR